MEELKPVNFSSEETEVQLIVADNCKLSQTKHLFASFILVTVVLYFVTFLSPLGKSQTFSSVSLPVYAGSGPFDIKINMNDISPFYQRISIYSRFISENFQGNVITNGSCEFIPYKNSTKLEIKNVNFKNQTFELTAKGSAGSWIELLDIDLIYFDSFEVISHFSSAAKHAVSIEFKVETSTVAFTCFDIWCRFSFAVALSIVLMRNSSFSFSDEYNFSFFTYLLLLVNFVACNPLHVFSFVYPSRIFFLVDYVLRAVQEAYNIFYCCWIYSTTSYSSNISFLIAFVALYAELSPIISENYGPELSPSMKNEANIHAFFVFASGMLACSIIGQINEGNYDLQFNTRKLTFVIIIILTRMPHYAMFFIPSEGHFNGNPVMHITHYISNTFFAILMLYVNLRLPKKSMNIYQEAEVTQESNTILDDGDI